MARSTATFRRDAISRSITKASPTWGGLATSDLDIYSPSSVNRPVVIILHGSWAALTPWRSYAPLTALAYSLCENGFVAVIPDFYQVPVGSGNVDTVYRQGMITDILSLMTWLRANIGSYNGDSARLVILGESAGGQLGLMVGIQGTMGSTRPDAIVAWSPTTRLDRSVYASGQTYASVGVLMNNYLATTDQSTGADAIIAQTYSPYNQVSSNLPPIRIVGSANESDPGVQQSDFDDMHTAALAVGVDSTKVILPGTVHADLRGLDNIGAMEWIQSKLPWSRASTRTSAGVRVSAGVRTAA